MSAPPDQPGTPLVLTPPAWARFGVILLGVAALVYLAVTRPDSVEALQADIWSVIAILCIVISPIAFIQRRRVELLGDDICEYVGSRLKHRVDIRDIERIKQSLGRHILVFRNGERIEINDVWPHADEVIATLQRLIDAKNRE